MKQRSVVLLAVATSYIIKISEMIPLNINIYKEVNALQS